ncbi:hypothetical protein ACHAWF_015943 [Thalassiosira exigua]
MTRTAKPLPDADAGATVDATAAAEDATDENDATDPSSTSPRSQSNDDDTGVDNGNDDDASSAAGAECLKCSVCRKRLGRKNCPHQACVQCCDDPSCEPHRDARDALRKNQSLLDGTDWITRTAARKRASRVGPGAFHEPNVHYFGETVVLWDVREFMANPKWREDAVRRSRGMNELQALEIDAPSGRRKRKRNEQLEEEEKADGTASSTDSGKEAKQQKGTPLSRRRKFEAICDELYQKSLENTT